MGRCQTCGNDYERSLDLTLGDTTYTFDCFECAIHAFSPRCATCRTRVIGHGVQVGEVLFCCAHCARQAGATDVRDHAQQ